MDKRLHQALLVLTVIGAFVSIYMTIYKLTDNNAMCLGNGGCSAVNASPFSSINFSPSFKVPVAAVGVLGYAAILVLVWLENRGGFLRRNASLLVFGLALTGFLFTLYLIYIEIAIIKSICPFCLASQVTMTLIFVISVIRMIRQPQF